MANTYRCQKCGGIAGTNTAGVPCSKGGNCAFILVRRVMNAIFSKIGF